MAAARMIQTSEASPSLTTQSSFAWRVLATQSPRLALYLDSFATAGRPNP